MRVLDIDNNYSPTGGGVRTYHERKVAWFRERGDPYAFVVPSDRSERVQDGCVTTYHVPAVPLGGSGYRWIVRARPLRGIFREFRPDVVEVGSPYVLPRLVGRALRRTRLDAQTATVGFYHSDVPDTLIRPAASRLGLRFGDQATGTTWRWLAGRYEDMSAVFGASEFVLRKLSANGVRRLFHTPLGVDTGVFHPGQRSDAWRAECDVGADDTLVLYLARLSAEKGLRTLFDAYEGFAAEGTTLVVVGHGPLQTELDAFAARHPRVVTLPYMSNPHDVARAYASSDVFLSLGAVETYSLSTAEALACGARVVAPADGGAGEQVARVTPGTLFRAGDSADLARVVRAMAGTPQPNAAGAEDWSAVFSRELAAYERVVDAKRRGRLEQLEAPGGWWPANENDDA